MAAAKNSPPLNAVTPLRRTTANRFFALIYASALLALFYRHVRQIALLRSTTPASVVAATLSLLVADATLAFMWCTTQSSRMYPTRRTEYVENIPKVLKEADFPALDVFICTADPYKEPPIRVVNTALSVMAYEYPANKLSVYLSDDGGSQLTLFAFMEAAKFASHWLPFCRENKVMERSPEDYFRPNQGIGAEAESIKGILSDPIVGRMQVMYEGMKVKIENVVAKGEVGEEFIAGDKERQALSQWTDTFTRQSHPPVIQVLVDNSQDRDIAGNLMPNLIYVSRGKSRAVHHQFKAGALNALVRVSTVMTNAPIFLTLDCDMRSNDPGTLRRVLCYFADPNIDQSKLSHIQFPQIFQGLNRDDIYAGSYKSLFHMNPPGMKNGPNYLGTGCFFHRRALFGGPTAYVAPEIPELSIDHVVERPIQSQETMELVHRVAGFGYENMTNWGSKVGFRYGSVVEDYYTGYLLHCEGWKSIFCTPDRPAFLGDAPTSLIDMLNQCKRWIVGLLEVVFSRYSVMTYGLRSMGLLMSLSYAQIAFWATWSIPLVVYSFVPQLALINGLPVFPKVSEPWFLLYTFLFLGAYSQDLVYFLLSGSDATLRRWWNDQRIWLIRGLTCYLFGSLEFTLKRLGISTSGFEVTSKAANDEQSKKYEQGVFDFGAPSPMVVPLSVAVLVNLVALARGLALAPGLAIESFALQVLLSGFGVVNGWPLYEAMFFRSDKGKLPTNITLASTFVAALLYAAASLA
ncbi:cellulose synthase-like protein G3 isoform X3 [Punica granatum]|uniref:Cellulose synthase-like protein G3 isoform X3 n=1 Tax=Punica granatum TaxID=22663 RepID=A0A6P8E5M3_PUNGR|nr:cellulose synthase-like protein G3 isoform X3 [Punica granatum]